MKSGVVKTAFNVVILFGLAAAAAATAAAQSIEEARTAFDDGRFLEAAELGEAIGTSESLTLANVSLVTHGYFLAEDDEKQAYYVRAMELGDRAVQLDPDDAESTLRWAQAMGRYAQTIGSMKAARQGYAGKIREAIEAALALDPENAMAHVSLAAWHAEGIKEGGFMARALFGASRKRAEEHYERAFELDPESKSVVYEYARGLLLLSGRKNRDRALNLFASIAELPSVNAADRLLAERAVRKLAKLEG